MAAAQEQIRALYEAAEDELSRVSERAVASAGFAGLLELATGNAIALARIATDSCDQVMRALRMAGRQDIVRLATQLNRTEDKLERVLAELEALRAEDRP